MSSSQVSAALTGALLANKGAAAPSGAVSTFLNDLSTKKPTIAEQQVCKVPRRRSVPLKPVEAVTPRAALGSMSSLPNSPRAKLSVRLDQGRHLRLKLAAAHLQRSSQTIMIEALDAYLASTAKEICGQCACLNDDG
jgi:hypothetical protein